MDTQTTNNKFNSNYTVKSVKHITDLENQQEKGSF